MMWAVAVATAGVWVSGAKGQESGESNRNSPTFARVVEAPPKNPGSWGIGGMGKLSSGRKKTSTSIGLRPVRKNGQGGHLLEGAETEKKSKDGGSEMSFEVVDNKTGEAVKTGEVVTGKVDKPAKNTKAVQAVKSSDATVDRDSSAPGFGGLGGSEKKSSMATTTGKTTALKRPGGAKQSERLLKGKTAAELAAAEKAKAVAEASREAMLAEAAKKSEIKKSEAKKKEAIMLKSKVAASDVDTKPDSVVPAGMKSAAVALSPEADSGVGAGEVVLVNDEDSGSVRVVEGGDDTMLPTWEGGYYPTQDDYQYRTWDYPRSRGGVTNQPPDNISLNADGLFPYEDPDVVGRPNYDTLFVPANRVLGFFAPRQAYALEGEHLGQGWSFAGDARLPLFNRSFEPDRAHFKVGPVYADLLYIGVGTFWSDYNGDQTFTEGQEPGWIPYIEFAPRILVRLTDQFYLSAAARLVYMPVENRIGFDTGYGAGPLLYARINYQKNWNSWDFIVYDEISATTEGVLSRFGADAFQQAGRYSFGVRGYDNQSGDPFDGDDVYFSNTIGAGASTPFLQEDWRLWLNAQHHDFWRTFDFDEHGVRDSLGARVAYSGDNFPFSPYVEYEASSYDHFDSVYNTAYVGGSGRLTENVTTDGRVGYLWTRDRNPDRESPLWRLGVTHRISEDTSHSLWGGESWESNDFTNETALARYIRYNIAHRFSRRLSGGAYAQWSEEEDLVAGTPVTDRESYAGLLSYQAWEFTSFTAGAYYEKRRRDTPPSITEKNWVYRAGVVQQLYSRYTLNFIYQYEDQSGIKEYSENMFQLSLRKYF